MRERDWLIIRILHLAYLVHTATDYCVFIRFSGHINQLEIDIRQSQERWQERVLVSEFYTSYQDMRADGMSIKTAYLKSKIEVLERTLTEQEIPFDDLEYEEEYSRLYAF